jgi:cardiolipin synthase
MTLFGVFHIEEPYASLVQCFGWAVHFLIFLLVCSHCLKTRREATSTLLWIFVTAVFPIIGPLAYISFGIDRVPNKGFRKQIKDQRLLAERKAREDEALPLAYWQSVHEDVAAEPPAGIGKDIDRAMNSLLSEYPLLGGNEIRPLVNGDEAYPAMLDAIRHAQHHVHLQCFLIRNDSTGREFLDLLAEKARSGVQVRLLFDRFGSAYASIGGFFRKYRHIPNMQVIGWTQANPLKRQFQINLRNHRKVLVVDGKEAFFGGINLHDDHKTVKDRQPIRDYHFAVRGPIVQELQYSFMRDWYFMTDEDPEILLTEFHFPHLAPVGNAMIRLINSGPTFSEMEVISDIFFMALTAAHKQILAVTPYFVPSRDIVQAFRAAALRGVDVRLIVPAKNNHVYAGLAGCALYEDLLDAGVRIFERHPPFMHAKALIVDDGTALVGTANMDVRSLRLNYETNVAVYDDAFINRLKEIVLEEISLSDEINLGEWRLRPSRQRIMENLSYLMMPIL